MVLHDERKVCVHRSTGHGKTVRRIAIDLEFDVQLRLCTRVQTGIVEKADELDHGGLHIARELRDQLHRVARLMEVDRQVVEVRSKVEGHLWGRSVKVEVLRKPRQPVHDAQGGTTVKHQVFEPVALEQRPQDDVL